MTTTKVLKELLKINLDGLNDCLKSKLKIKFKNGEFIVLNKKGEIVLKDKLSNYGLDFKSQKEFVFNIIKKLFIWIKREDWNKDYFKNMIEIDNKYYSDNRIIHKCILHIGHIENINILNYIKYNKEVSYIADYDEFTVYYSFTQKRRKDGKN